MPSYRRGGRRPIRPIKTSFEQERILARLNILSQGLRQGRDRSAGKHQ